MEPGTPLRSVLGDKTARVLASGLDLHTVHDLLRHYPRRYYARGELTDLRDLRPGELVTIQARVESLSGRRLRPKLHKLDVRVSDGPRQLTLTFFNKPWLENKLHPGRSALFSGKVELFKRQVQITNPEVHVGDEAEEFAGSLLPVYAATSALASWRVAQCVRMILDTLGPVPDPLPADLRRRRGLLGLREAYESVHRPADHVEERRARERLRFEEAFVLQVELARRRRAAAALPATPRPLLPGGVREAFERQLPFELTAGQRRVGSEIAADLAEHHPMHRLLQGEVGSGKTVVALQAMLSVVDTGGQAALLAPTEVLAQQHHRSITGLLGPLAERGLLGGADIGTRVVLLTGSQPAAVRRPALLDVASGEAGIVVGTHALLEEHVSFADLGLVVVDEQHRFGVEQRAALTAKGPADTRPHVLVMTATPIPRTVAMTVFGDLETSTLAELPGGRAEVATHVVPAGEKPHYLDRAWERVREEAEAGHRAYIVCPRIGDDPGSGDDSDGAGGDMAGPGEGMEPDAEGVAEAADPGARRPLAVLEIAALLRDGPLAGLAVETLHGRMPAEVKDDVMRRFAAGEVSVLVATTVVEVGVDVADATVMVVMDAERFGVSQLHQLRGRIGRGNLPGLCLLVTDAPEGTPARQRLEAVASTRDGFELSEVDLAQRREGDVLGAAQSGRRSSLRLLSVVRDADVIASAREEATAAIAVDPDLTANPALAAEVAALVEDDRADYLDKA